MFSLREGESQNRLPQVSPLSPTSMQRHLCIPPKINEIKTIFKEKGRKDILLGM